MYAKRSSGAGRGIAGRAGVLVAGGLLALLAACQDAVVAPREEGGGAARANTLAGAPAADVSAGARELPDLSFANGASSRPCTRWATPEGDDANAGTWEAPYRNVTKLLAVLMPGEVGCVLPGSYPVTRGVPARPGDPNNPIILRGGIAFSDHYSELVAARGSPVLDIDKPYWIIEGFEFYADSATAVQVKRTAHHVVLRNNQVFGSHWGADVSIAGQHVSLSNNQLYGGPHKNPALDSHAVVITPGAQRVLVQGNHIYEGFTGDGIQCQVGGSEALVADLPTDITLRGNAIYGRLQSGAAAGENAIDIKTCHYVTIADGNYHGFAPTWKSSSNNAQGEAIVVHYNARHVRIENNRISDACVALGVGRGEDAATLTSDVVVSRNAIFRLPSGTDPASGITCKGDGIVLSRVHRADVYHNTLSGVPRRALSVALDNKVDAMPGVEFWNNIVHDATDWLYVNASGVTGFATSNNLYHNTTDADARNIVVLSGTTSSRMTLATWQAKGFAGAGSVAVADASSLSAPPAFLAETYPQWPETYQFAPAGGSPARNAALNNTGATPPDGNPDIGWKEGS